MPKVRRRPPGAQAMKPVKKWDTQERDSAIVLFTGEATRMALEFGCEIWFRITHEPEDTIHVRVARNGHYRSYQIPEHVLLDDLGGGDVRARMDLRPMMDEVVTRAPFEDGR